MPQFNLPKPKNWDTFEDMVCDLMTLRLNCRNLQRYGRQGQPQSGVDIAGVSARQRIVGIQCKHHPDRNITPQEIKQEVEKSDQFSPKLNEFYIVTSANRDVRAHQTVLNMAKSREETGLSTVTIIFWDELVDWFYEYPTLLHKHFGKEFQFMEPQDFHPFEAGLARTTSTWPVTSTELQNNIEITLGDMKWIDPYDLAIGITCFRNTSFFGMADLQLKLNESNSSENDPPENFHAATETFKDLQAILTDRRVFSTELWVFLNVRLTIGFLFGTIFRKVTGVSLKIVTYDMVWGSHDLPQVNTGLTESLLIAQNHESDEIAVVLNISRDINNSVMGFVETWEPQPKLVTSWTLPDHTIRTAAHALTLAQEISQKLKAYMDEHKLTHVHLFGALPVSLAALISYHLNAFCPISIYFLDDDRQQYRLGGTLQNIM